MTNVYIDEIYLQEKLQENNLLALDAFIEACEAAESCPLCDLLIVDNIYELFFSGVSFTEALFKDANGNRDIINQIQRIIDRAETFHSNEQHEHGLPELLRVRAGGLMSNRLVEGKDEWDPSLMARIETAEQLPAALRLFFLSERKGDNELEEQASHLFPNVYFFKSVSLKKLGLPYLPNVRQLINHLAYLNDHALEHFNSGSLPQEIIAKAAALNVTISAESPNTRRNQRAMKEREITINSEVLVCEWHSKITYSTGRIHFYAYKDVHPKIYEECRGKVIVGVVAPHLTT